MEMERSIKKEMVVIAFGNTYTSRIHCSADWLDSNRSGPTTMDYMADYED
jgi:hypothetical protein